MHVDKYSETKKKKNGNIQMTIKRPHLERLLHGLYSLQCSFQGQSQHACYSRGGWLLWPAVGVAAAELRCFPSNKQQQKQRLIINWIQSIKRKLLHVFLGW